MATKRKPRRTIVVGDVFGFLTVISLHSPPSNGRHAYWLCRCECGREKPIRSVNLTRGLTRRCGCRPSNYKHGMKHTPEYMAWADMKRRCYTPTAGNFHDYGGRGITVCDRWRESFAAFYADVGPRPSPHHSIDRKNVHGNYDPDNVRWATTQQQNSNRRDSNRISVGNEIVCGAELARRLGVSRSSVNRRIKRGQTAEQIIAAIGQQK